MRLKRLSRFLREVSADDGLRAADSSIANPPLNWTRTSQFPLDFQANPQGKSSVYSKTRLTFPGRVLL